MLEALGSKILTGVVSLSMLLFSSFKGNDPRFSAIDYYYSSTTLYLSGELLSAFDNDFDSIFASSATIPVYFTLSIKSGNRTVVNQQLRHLVSYDPVSGIYVLRKDGDPNILRSSSVQQIIKEMSQYGFSLPYKSSWGLVTASVKAEMPTVRLDNMDNELDLMVLWKYKKPSAKIQINLQKAQ
ncbi:MAG: hypothetical protein LHW58_01600 [Candidatus Cloacimonetes bacterium]|nr:hypothetical protein [Candidatus Cloacimonadota bacterium]MCK9178494.1 hypothetical protein [Candidatus Cloacimonadota bacterium]